jgi:3-oxoacyl-[acyl-carrier protein] reductase
VGAGALGEEGMEISLKGRTAIVTGGSKGIGYAVATRFAASGADVAILARTRQTLDEAVKAIQANAKSRVIGVQADVSAAADIQRAYDEVMKAFGKVDIVVNNAGTSRNGAFEKLTDEILQKDLEDKLFAAIRMIRLVAPQMKERRWGRIINVLNIGAKAPRANSMPTSVSRAAGMAMTKALSQELAPFNVLVNAMLVGFIEADQHVQAAKRANVPLADYIKAREKEIPLGRIGKAEEFANMACFLVSDAGAYITGTATNIDGGRSPVV